MKKYNGESLTDLTGLVKFGADWCGPCRALEPVLEKLEEESEVEVLDVDIDSNSELAQTFFIRSVPTVIAFKDGEPVEQLIGAYPMEAYKELLEKVK